jgi:hypothetical protein
MSYFDKIRLAAAIGPVAVLPAVIAKAQAPQETPIHGTVQLPNEGSKDSLSIEACSPS